MSAPHGDEAQAIASAGELLAHAYRMEEEAEERYHLLADQMEMHNNPALCTLFRKLAKIEAVHAADIRQQMDGMDIPDIKPWEYKWDDPEGPETVDIDAAHYKMTPWHAVSLALRAEEKAFAFFDQLARETTHGEVKKLAVEFAEEEKEHVELMRLELAKHSPPDAGWSDDLDPAEYQE